jgi:hypothetical protein
VNFGASQLNSSVRRTNGGDGLYGHWLPEQGASWGVVMTIDGFRRLAVRMPGAVEVGHMGHPDFRVGGQIFATLGYPTGEWAMVKLAPEQQEAFCAAEPSVFVPVKGKWGERGATNVCLRPAKASTVRLALTAAWRGVAPRVLAHQVQTK